ncbi:MAG: hypothetical protein HKM95_12030, partial [Inquilinus sp.]|nr:hypothetical protein [Inquilinus sp.]
MQVASTKLLALGAALVLVAGCSRAVQTTAGEDYLSFYTEADTIGTSKAGDPVREIASIEPLLQFPARIGVARVELGDLVPVPRAEAVAWAEAAERLGPTFGT